MHLHPTISILILIRSFRHRKEFSPLIPPSPQPRMTRCNFPWKHMLYFLVIHVSIISGPFPSRCECVKHRGIPPRHGQPLDKAALRALTVELDSGMGHGRGPGLGRQGVHSLEEQLKLRTSHLTRQIFFSPDYMN